MIYSGEDYHALIDFNHLGDPEEQLAFDGFDRVIMAKTIEEVLPALKQVEAECQSGCTAVGFITYEAARAFDSALKTYPTSDLPLLFFGLSDSPMTTLSLNRDKSAELPKVTPFEPSWSLDDYLERFRRVKRHIYDGDTYQINLTFPLRARLTGDVHTCYEKLRSAQDSGYCGLISGPDFSIASVSPELFFERHGARITTRPMKGTRKRGRNQEEDQAISTSLLKSEKDRAENVMIVDLLRNDLGRVAKTGSVHVPKLFSVEKYSTVWQMTSTVEAEVDPTTTLTDIFKALFPCGSVTGAPKVKTMEMIHELEDGPRGVYCGAFGIIHPGGDCIFNVPIRTMTVIGDSAEYPVGSGLISGSGGQEEYEECLIKSQILERGLSEYELLETIAWHPHRGFYLLEGHISRQKRSAELLGFLYDENAIRAELERSMADCSEAMRLRLLVSANGKTSMKIHPLREFNTPVRTVKLADEPIDSSYRFLYHKTTRRDIYNRERERLGDADDAILYNKKGEITESTIANVAVQIDGAWYTPPDSCGLLPGVMREELLSKGDICQRVITVEELLNADRIRLMNSVRGLWDVRLYRKG